MVGLSVEPDGNHVAGGRDASRQLDSASRPLTGGEGGYTLAGNSAYTLISASGGAGKEGVMGRRAVTVLVCGGAIIAVSMGVRQAFGIFLRPIAMDLGIGREVF